jgi:hypothetical protein
METCTAWRTAAIKQILEVHPSVVFIANGTYLTFGGERDETRLSLVEWHEGTSRTLRLFNSAGLWVMQLRDNPRATFDVPTCLARRVLHPWYPRSACVLDRGTSLPPALFESEVDAARWLPNVSLVDLSDQFCRGEVCQTIQDGIVMYQDSNHVSSKFIDRLQPIIEARLVAIVSQATTQ